MLREEAACLSVCVFSEVRFEELSLFYILECVGSGQCCLETTLILGSLTRIHHHLVGVLGQNKAK